MKSMKTYIRTALITLLFTSCVRESSDSVDQDKIWTKYEIIYDKNEDQTTVRVEFRFGVQASGRFYLMIEPEADGGVSTP